MHDTTDLASQARQLLERQKSAWNLARNGYAALATVQTRTIPLDDFAMRLQFNPARIVSTGAKVDAKTISERKCFLCAENRPTEQQATPFGEDYLVLVNPFPIFPEHFTITHRRHVPQRIADAFASMLDLARAMSPRYTVFYNGPKCGASAPDHLHFQAGDRGFMTIEQEYGRLQKEVVIATAGATVFATESLRPFISIESSRRDLAITFFKAIYGAFSEISQEPDEPMMNVLCWFDAGRWTLIIFPRAKHRPSFYFAEGDDKILLSPACVDLGGVCIVPVEKDYHQLTSDHLRQMLAEVMLSPEQFRLLRLRMGEHLERGST